MSNKKAAATNSGLGAITTAGNQLLSASNYTPPLPQLQEIDAHLAAMHASVGSPRWLDAFGAFLDAVEGVTR